jgi:radical SAM superfamily enzyme YgiQ (UPF0313 family)
MNVIMWNALVVDKFVGRTIGPYKLAHWLRKNSYDVQVIDFVHFLSEERLFNVTSHFITADTKILGVSTTFFPWEPKKHSDGVERRIPESMFNVLKRIKLEYPQIKIVLGGYQSESFPSYGIIDATVMSYTGSTEEIFLEYLEHLILGTPPPHSEILLQSGNKNRPFYNRALNVIYNIENDDFKFTKQDCILPGEPLPLDISRGCIFACKFCQYQHIGKKKYDYVRGMELIEQEILNNYELSGTTSYYLLDDTFNDTQQKLEEFLAMTKRLPFKLSYTAYIRGDLVHRFPETPFILKDSGLFGAYFGLESLHPDASKLIGKAWSGKHARSFIPELCHNIWNDEVLVHTNFIVGLTHDTPENIYDTAQWYLDNNMHSIVFERLGLWGTKDTGRFQIRSEFDRNSEKYGYTLEYKDDSPIPDWKTDNWTKASATQVTINANNKVISTKKANPWKALTYNWLGISKEDLLTKPGAPLYSQIFDDPIKLRNLLEQYFKLLLNQ